MSARAAAGNAEVIRSDAIFGGVMADEADRSMNVLLDFRNNESWLRTVHDRKNRVTAFKKRLISPDVDSFMAGNKAATDHENNSESIGFGRLKDVHGQG